jgi:hypothetical protein
VAEGIEAVGVAVLVGEEGLAAAFAPVVEGFADTPRLGKGAWFGLDENSDSGFVL